MEKSNILKNCFINISTNDEFVAKKIFKLTFIQMYTNLVAFTLRYNNVRVKIVFCHAQNQNLAQDFYAKNRFIQICIEKDISKNINRNNVAKQFVIKKKAPYTFINKLYCRYSNILDGMTLKKNTFNVIIHRNTSNPPASSLIFLSYLHGRK